jgi:hypothetical protein
MQMFNGADHCRRTSKDLFCTSARPPFDTRCFHAFSGRKKVRGDFEVRSLEGARGTAERDSTGKLSRGPHDRLDTCCPKSR